jgi:hypothetical protein
MRRQLVASRRCAARPLGEKEFEMCYWLKLSSLALLLGATAWLVKTPDWEPLLAFIGSLTAFLVQDIREFKKANSTKGIIDKDKENFEKYNAILPDSELLDELNNAIFNLRTDMGFVKRLGQFLRRAEQIEGEFNEKHIQKTFSEAVENLKKLKAFLAKHFFVPNEGVTDNSEGEFLLYLYPDLKYSNDSEKRQIYKDRERELHVLIDQVINSYECYRKLIKKKIHI